MRTSPLIALVLMFGASIAAAQSLADVAKKTEAERAAAKADASKGKTSFSNKDLKDEPAPAVPAAQTPTPSKDATASTSASSTTATEQTETQRQDAYRKDAKKDETYWKDRMLTAQRKLKADEAFLADAVSRESTLDKRLHKSRDNNDYIFDRLERATVNNQWQDTVAEVGRLKAQIETDKQAIKDVETDAHAAGVPPGWLIQK